MGLMSHVFTRRLTLEVAAHTPDGGGGFTTDWQERGGFWAEVRMRSGSLRYSAFGRTERMQVRIRTHVVPEGHPMRPEPGHRLRDGGQIYEVEAVHSNDGHLLTILGSAAARAGGAT